MQVGGATKVSCMQVGGVGVPKVSCMQVGAPKVSCMQVGGHPRFVLCW